MLIQKKINQTSQAQTQNNQQLPTGDETIRAMKAAQAEAKRELKGIDKQLTALGTAIETLGGEFGSWKENKQNWGQVSIN